MNRRGFLSGMAGILAAGVAPAYVGSSILMPVRMVAMPPDFVLWGDGIHDDSPAMEAWVNGGRVVTPAGLPIGDNLEGLTIRLSRTLYLPDNGPNRSMIGNRFEYSPCPYSAHGYINC